MKNDIKTLLLSLLLITVLGGIIAFILGMVLTPIQAAVGIWGNVLALAIAFFALLLIVWGTKTKIENMNPVNMLIMFAGIAMFGSILTTIMPSLSPYILSINFTVTGMVWAIIYTIAAELIISKVLKKK
jgi:hypothetical protein